MARSKSHQGFSSFTGSAGAERKKPKGHHLFEKSPVDFFKKEAKKQKTSLSENDKTGCRLVRFPLSKECITISVNL